jgi:catechol-2,3-dioxygenase
MSVQVYLCNHIAIEVGDIEKAVAFYEDVFGLKKLDEGEGDAFFKLGEHQFLAMFERKGMKHGEGEHHFGIMVRDDAQIAEVREKLTGKYGLNSSMVCIATSATRGAIASRSSISTTNRSSGCCPIVKCKRQA